MNPHLTAGRSESRDATARRPALFVEAAIAVLVATVVPWYFGLLATNVLSLAGCLGLLMLAQWGARRIERELSDTRARRAATLTLQGCGVLLLAAAWDEAGGLQNPALLLCFALPVFSASMVSRSEPWYTAAACILAVAGYALLRSPELRWQFGIEEGVLTGLFGAPQSYRESSEPFAGFFAPVGYYSLLLQVCATGLLACAAVAEQLAARLRQLRGYVFENQSAAEAAHLTTIAILRSSPIPTALLRRDNLGIVTASDSFAALAGTDAESIEGLELTEALNFGFPEVIEELVLGEGGEREFCTLRRKQSALLVRVRVRHLQIGTAAHAIVTLEDRSDAWMLATALDLIGVATVVLDESGCARAFNGAARTLFPQLEHNADCARLLTHLGAAPRWWESGISHRRICELQVSRRDYRVSAATIAWPGEDARLFVISFVPLAQARA